MPTHHWTIPGADDQPIFGATDLPDGQPRGAIIIAHGFKGYKDYGMFPRIAQSCAAIGLVAHRFNFSHSGMTNHIDTFERPDLFERDTWSKQVYDLHAVIDAAHEPGSPLNAAQRAVGDEHLPYFLFGHSRGGVAVLLTAGRLAGDRRFPKPAGVITAAAPDRCNSLSDEDAARLLEIGYLDSPSSRTGQVLRLGRAFLQEQLDDPANHDVLAMVMRVAGICPLLVIHGEDDPTVPPDAARRIAEAAGQRAELLLIPGADHVFNTPNPMPDDAQPSQQLQALLTATARFVQAVID